MNFYGDQTRWFVARVVDWEDDYKGRVKIRVLGLHSESINDEDLPWAKCVLPTTEGGTSGIGKIPQVLNGAFVFGMFLDGAESQMPIVLGSLPQFEVLSSTQRRQVEGSGRGTALSGNYIVDGVILDPDLINLYDNGNANLETRAIIAMQFLLDAGVANQSAAAGIVGNLIGESNIRSDGPVGPFNEEGIAQWNPAVGRLQKLKEYTRENFPGKDYTDFFVQLNFLVWEMKNNSAHEVWGLLSDPLITHEFKVEVPYNQQQDTNATYYFLRKYEVPADIEVRLLERQEYAQFAYDAYEESKRLTAAHAASGAA
jgi:hypothetical protein